MAADIDAGQRPNQQRSKKLPVYITQPPLAYSGHERERHGVG